MNLKPPIEPCTTLPGRESIHIDEVFYCGCKIRILAIYHAGESKWEGWSGISFTQADHFIGNYSGLLDLRETKEDALAIALHVAMAWLDESGQGLASSIADCTLLGHKD